MIDMENTTINNSSRFPVSAQALLELQLSDWQFIATTEGTPLADLAIAKREIARLNNLLNGESWAKSDTHVRTETHGDEPAFVVVGEFDGLSKREFFAGRALTGLLAHGGTFNDTAAYIAVLAVEHADALIEALNK